MKTEYDPKADAMYIRLIAGTVVESDEVIRVRFQLLEAAANDEGLRQAVWAASPHLGLTGK